jgi:hypothetical protein
MGEHKFPKQVGEPNGDQPKKVSTHICKIVDMVIPLEVSALAQEKAVEDAFQAISDRATQEDSFILTVAHSVQLYQVIDAAMKVEEHRMLVTIVAQRIGREDLERQQRAQALSGVRR